MLKVTEKLNAALEAPAQMQRAITLTLAVSVIAVCLALFAVGMAVKK